MDAAQQAHVHRTQNAGQPLSGADSLVPIGHVSGTRSELTPLASAISTASTAMKNARRMPVNISAGARHMRPRSDYRRLPTVTIKNEKNEAVLAAVRSHLRSIAADFARGEFDKPFQTHAEVPPGVAVMQTDRESISYRYQDLPQGGAVRIVTTDARARAAVYEFLRYQIKEHQTSDPLDPQR